MTATQWAIALALLAHALGAAGTLATVCLVAGRALQRLSAVEKVVTDAVRGQAEDIMGLKEQTARLEQTVGNGLSESIKSHTTQLARQFDRIDKLETESAAMGARCEERHA